MNHILLRNCKELLTIKKNAKDMIGLEKNKSVLIENDRIVKIDDDDKFITDRRTKEIYEIDCSQKVVMPGYVDSHTHLIFGGSRVDEYVGLLTNSPQKVKKMFPKFGLESSIDSTKNASDTELIHSTLQKLHRMLKSGTTTVEIKSGYGIDKTTELRQLRLLNVIRKMTDQTIVSTYLGAHYFDKKMGKKNYIDFMIKEVMPVISEESLATFCDVWVDEGYYTKKEAEKILQAGIDHGMTPTMHTECYSAIGGIQVAANLHAANVGHLNYIHMDDIPLLVKSNVVGVLIPGTDFSVKHPKPFDPRPMINQGLSIALASNLNPGNWIESMQLTMALACRNHQMTDAEAIRAATLGGAKALQMEQEIGSIEIGKKADIQILHSDSYKNCVYKIGINEVEHVIKNGKLLF